MWWWWDLLWKGILVGFCQSFYLFNRNLMFLLLVVMKILLVSVYTRVRLCVWTHVQWERTVRWEDLVYVSYIYLYIFLSLGICFITCVEMEGKWIFFGRDGEEEKGDKERQLKSSRLKSRLHWVFFAKEREVERGVTFQVFFLIVFLN